MRTKQMKMIQGNLSDSQELKQLISQFPNENIPTEIKETNKHCFNFIGINMKRGAGLSMSLRVRQFVKTVELWDTLTDFQKRPEIIGAFDTVIMIHNPLLPEKRRTKKS